MKKNSLIPLILILVAVLAMSVAIVLYARYVSGADPEPVITPEVPSEPLPEPDPSPETAVTADPTPQPVSTPEPEAEQEISPLYCTIWPITDLDVYSDGSKENVIGTAPASAMYCVLEEDAENALFRIRLSDGVYGYIDSTFCLINLPEYIGGLCSYDITNSYSSLYAIHEYEIPGLTGKVITGYENIRLADGSYLVPFLYPCTQKLISAANRALESGYRIRIYDSYRPRCATNHIYNTAVSILDVMLPSATYSGAVVSLPPIPEPKEDEPPRSYLKYRDLIERNGWDIGSFLAPGWSQHNRGVAIDMTFEDAVSGEAITAQTNMHDLSSYSTIYSNNQAASSILSLMEASGLHNIVSEWWHFQDNEIINSLKPPYCENGVSAEGWIADEAGEMYRNADGTLMIDCVMVTDEGNFVFDPDGHLVP
ncbi:MAG: D-alanyl-D-alanine carboxypeptidase family protein [Oscillospiraceae bacterium]|nr:D-alanyl-D-alanine carboxypeptidase family protein [Oscillospiraceae bacterium]